MSNRKQRREAIESLMVAVRALQRTKAFTESPTIMTRIDKQIEEARALQRQLERMP